MVEYRGMNFPDDLYYHREWHLWVRVEGRVVRVGLDDLIQRAAKKTGGILYVSIMPAGKKVEKGKDFGAIETGKYVGPLKAPVSGRIVEVNEELDIRPNLIHESPYGQGWFVVIEPDDFEKDLTDLVHGDELQPWLKAEVEEYERKGQL